MTATPISQPSGFVASVLLRPIHRFMRLEAASSILLLLCAVVALVWANSPWAASYFHVWEIDVAIRVGAWGLTKSLHHWINDGLMAVFFFVIGLEIKREVLLGELAELRQAALPLAAALGGMLVPAALYAALNAGTPALRGWGIPMATDIAFALGVLTLLGPRVPFALKIFLTALAIVDDLGAVLVIALFYTAELSGSALLVAAAFLAAMFAVNRGGVRHPIVYLVLGVGLWFAVLQSGIHATVAGVLGALAIPARGRIDATQFVGHATSMLDLFAADRQQGAAVLTSDQQYALQQIERGSEAVQTPLSRFEHALHGWVIFVIMPIFALANAGVALTGGLGTLLTAPVALGIMIGLFVGKQVGVLLFAWLAVRLRIAVLPPMIGWRQIYGVSLLCGIGFTMSLFIASLAFDGAPATLDAAKTGILAASLLAGVAGYVALKSVRQPE